MAITLQGVATASTTLDDGTVVELVTNGASTMTLQEAVTLPSSLVSVVASYTFGTDSASFAQPIAATTIALASRRSPDGAADDVFVIGPRGDTNGALLVAWWRRTKDGGGASVWTLVGTRSGFLPAGSTAVGSLSAVYVPPTSSSGRESIFVLGRRVAPRNADGIFFANVNLASFASGAGLFSIVGKAPAWAPAMASGDGTNPLPPVDVDRITGSQVAIFIDQEAIVSVADGGAPSSVYRPPSGITVAFGAPYARMLACGVGAIASLSSGGGTTGSVALFVTVRNSAGNLLANLTLNANDLGVLGGTWGTKWAAYYTPITDEIVIYYLGTAARTLRSVSIPLATLIVGTPVTLTSIFGSSGATLSALRVQDSGADERRIRVAASQTLSGAESTVYYLDGSRNIAPGAPTITQTPQPNDAGGPITLRWGFFDRNPRDVQTAYDVQVQRVSDSVNVVNLASVPSATASHTIAAGTLVNGTAYRYRIRTYDARGVLGAWSAYASFTPNSLGSVAITNPATDDAPGIDTAKVTITWAGTPGSAGAFTGYRVEVYDTTTPLAPPTVYNSPTTYATSQVVDVPTGRRVRVQVWLRTASGETTPAIRHFTSSYSLPMPATATSYVDPSLAAQGIAWTVPAISGSRPATTLYVVERKGPEDDAFVPFASIAAPGGAVPGTALLVWDAEVASDVGYEYRIRSYAASSANEVGPTLSVAAPAILGAWLHRVSDPMGTLRSFPYATKKKVARAVASEVIEILGRRDPIPEFSDEETHTIALTVGIPHGVGTDAGVAWWRDALRARGTLCYRDSRQRITFGVLQSYDETDTKEGTTIAATLTRVAFTRSPADAAT